VTWHTSPTRTLADARKRETVMGGSGPTSPTVFYLRMLNALAGTHFKIIQGFPGGAETELAMQRGEVEGGSKAWASMKVDNADWVRDKKVNILLQAALKKDADLPEVPLMTDKAKTDDQRQVLRLILSTQQIARPYAAPPGIPADRAAALRKAFDETMQDPEFRAEMDKAKAEVNPTKGADVETLLKEVYASPKAIANAAAKAINY